MRYSRTAVEHLATPTADQHDALCDLGLRLQSHRGFDYAGTHAGVSMSVVQPEPNAELRMTAETQPWLNDREVGCTVAVFDDAAALRRLVMQVASLATSVQSRAHKLRSPSILREAGLSREFKRVAREMGLKCRFNALTADGELQNVAISVRWQTRDPSARSYTTSVRWLGPLGFKLSIRRATIGDRARAALAPGDLSLADPEFDRAWTVATDDEDRAREALNAETRTLVAQLAAAGLSFEITDEGLQGRGEIPSAPATVPDVMRLFDELAATLCTKTIATPYRS